MYFLFGVFIDVVRIDKTDETFRLLYDVKGRFTTHRINKAEGQFKLCKVVKQTTGAKGVPYIVTHDGRTIRYPDPHVKVLIYVFYSFFFHFISVSLYLKSLSE